MSITQTTSEQATPIPTAARVDLKLEVVAIPVSDIDRAKRFYGSLGFRLDIDFVMGKDFRGVQMTPPGSPCSNPLRQRSHHGRAGLSSGNVPCRH